MESIQNVGEREYEAAEEPGLSPFKLNLKLLWYLWIFIKSVVIGSLQTIFECLGCLFFKKRMKSLTEQLVLVTGGGNGLGRRICFELAKEKCKIVIADLDIAGAQKTVSDLQSLGIEARAYKVDVSNYQQVVDLRNKIIEDFGIVNILINNAGLLAKFSLMDGSPEDIQKVIDVNISSNFWTTRVFLKDMVVHKRGHIIGISSVFGLLPCGRLILYSTTKFAVRGFMASLNEEIRFNKLSKHIKTTCIYPQFIATRKELISSLDEFNLRDRILVMPPTFAAKEIVKAIKQEKLHLTLPNGSYFITCLLQILPNRILERYVDVILGETKPT
ncbi:estradiol 17-beta-dehydrogenase 11 [Sergentomyia squamirostris]